MGAHCIANLFFGRTAWALLPSGALATWHNSFSGHWLGMITVRGIMSLAQLLWEIQNLWHYYCHGPFVGHNYFWGALCVTQITVELHHLCCTRILKGTICMSLIFLQHSIWGYWHSIGDSRWRILLGRLCWEDGKTNEMCGNWDVWTAFPPWSCHNSLPSRSQDPTKSHQ